jgi:nucleoid DNA-binding protein
MKREELARVLSKQTNLSPAAARDQIDELVHRILKTLREGRPVELPGVGKLIAKSGSRRGPQ